MRTVQQLTIVSVIVLAAGCASNPPKYAASPVYTEESAPSTTDETQPVYAPAVNVGQGPAAAAEEQNDADQDLAISIRHEFDRYGDLSGVSPNIHIIAHRGAVTLTGSVPDEKDKQMIDALVRNSPGVVRLDNDLLVAAPQINSPPAPPPTGLSSSRVYAVAPGDLVDLHVQTSSDQDWQLAQDILDDLQNSRALAPAPSPVQVYVASGRVVLRGTVQSEQQRQALATAILRAAGPGNLQNELLVQP